MSRCSKSLLAAVLMAGTLNAQAFEGLGREATPDEVKAWDIDVRPDFKGLPKGRGTVDQGTTLWEEKCESCHGTFGESNEVFTPLVGGTTAEDIKTGHVLSLKTGSTPQRTTFMKVATISTLYDYIQRAMPWTSPKSLKPDEVYALLAYLLNLSNIVPADFELSDENIAEVQQRMPNRNGMTTDHGMWPGKGMGNGGIPDVKNTACMKNCKKAVEIASALPDYAADAHGNLADQNRLIGGVRGMQTGEAHAAAPAESAAPAGEALAKEKGCMACHGIAKGIVGPAYADVAAKYAGQADAEAQLVAKVKAGGKGVWGAVPMPPQGHVKDDEIQAIVRWILDGAKAQ
ncbi:c-type cytochrome [Nitrogeniibacter mangrovi]|uniref:C-type cytochrome n=1 Tax=Nitrogeniibacter mangrovi TaxID=2016596 RepID=A0A6C1B8G6_9RHOO|nr:c-type cytochrome [Nitrogeniibacter mangrovi]QID18630.1 c-type cytochrome [Nitrogeniibacter mangrovi]